MRYAVKPYMTEKLTEVEARIIGALVEKQLTTPEYYPLTLNALTAACNQKSNRDPVVSFDEETVTRTLENLRDKNLVYVFYGSTSRVPKNKHMLPQVFELEPSEVAVMCVLLLRGAQTLGELRGRTDRLYDFHGIGEVNETIDGLINRDEPLVVKLERQAGQKEARFAHLLSGEAAALSHSNNAPENYSALRQPGSGRMLEIEKELETLRNEFDDFRRTFEDFRKQFE